MIICPAPWRKLGAGLFLSPAQSARVFRIVPEHRYQFYLHAHEAWEAIYQACAAAEVSIVFEHFIFVDDESGRPFIDLFKAKARAGVKIRMILDALGSSQAWPGALVAELTAAGIEVEIFNTLIPGTVRYLRTWYFRDHRKIVVVDSRVAFTGGVCFQEHMRYWRDTCGRIEGPVVGEVEAAFDRMWRRAQKKRPRQRETYQRLAPGRPFVFLTHQPLPRRRFLYYEFLTRIRRAQRSIRLTTPYFVPNHKLARALGRAARRGVAVSLLIPAQSDQPLIDLAAQTYFTRLLRDGVKIYRGAGVFNHTKAGTVDDEWGTLGSLNLDFASLRYNFEANLLTTDPGFIAALDQQFAADCAEAQTVNFADWQKRSYYRQLLELLVRPLRFLL